MKKLFYSIAAVLAIFLTACSFFNKDEKNEYGTFYCNVTLEGGSGKATVESPAEVVVAEDKKTVKLVWSSPNYDYMIVDDVKYESEAATGENSVFTIPFQEFDRAFTVIADTTAMSTPHEIEYEITVYSSDTGDAIEKDEIEAEDISAETDLSLGNLKFESNYSMDYAKMYSIDFYIDEDNLKYAFITIGDTADKQYFLKPMDENGQKPTGLSDNIIYLGNVSNTYLVSTSVMDMICQIGALDDILFSGTKATDWYISEAREKMEANKILYAGKYSAPDYELLLSSGCNFAIENTMIYHNPEVKEKLEEIGIPVMVERSSYETNPLGRLEWIKLYGVLYGKQTQADEFFDMQVERVKNIEGLNSIKKAVAFFSVNSKGEFIVRKTNDYISTMIGMAGGQYVPEDIEADDKNALSTMKITAEDFYIRTVDADVLIYNSTIEGEVDSINELVEKASILKDYKALAEKNVYCLKEGYFQKSTNVAEFIEELNLILNDNFEEGDCFIKLPEN